MCPLFVPIAAKWSLAEASSRIAYSMESAVPGTWEIRDKPGALSSTPPLDFWTIGGSRIQGVDVVRVQRWGFFDHWSDARCDRSNVTAWTEFRSSNFKLQASPGGIQLGLYILFASVARTSLKFTAGSIQSHVRILAGPGQCFEGFMRSYIIRPMRQSS